VRARDSQRSRVYRWEANALDRLCGSTVETLDLQACAAVMERAWRDYWPGCPPQLRDGRGCRIARGGSLDIVLPRWARTERVVLHETTHALIDRAYSRTCAAHGPEFVRLYVDLLATYHYPRVSKAALRTSARLAGLRVARRAEGLRPDGRWW